MHFFKRHTTESIPFDQGYLETRIHICVYTSELYRIKFDQILEDGTEDSMLEYIDWCVVDEGPFALGDGKLDNIGIRRTWQWIAHTSSIRAGHGLFQRIQ